MRSKPLRIAALLGCLLPAIAAGQEAPRSVTLRGRTIVDQGLVGTGTLAAGTVDFVGDTLGSFSSLKIARNSWKRVGDHYEGVLWTLPDRGRNDPAARLFFDYPARLHRFRIRFSPADRRVTLIPDGGMVLRDFAGKPFTGADPDAGTLTQRGMVLPAPASGVGHGKVSLDAESLQFTRDGGFYVGDEYTAAVYYFDKGGRLRGVIQPPAAVTPRRDGKPFFGSLAAPDTGRRNNQGAEGMALSPDGRTLFVMLQSALVQDSATGNASGRVNTRVLVYDVSRSPFPARPRGHYIVQLPAYAADGRGKPDRTAAQSEIVALDGHRFLMLARDSLGFGSADKGRPVYKRVVLVDTRGATNLAGTRYETRTASLLRDADDIALKPGIVAAAQADVIDMLDPRQLERVGLHIDDLSEKWEAMDLVPALDPQRPNDQFLIVGNDNDFIARRCRMSGQSCDSTIDNDNRLLVYRLTLP